MNRLFEMRVWRRTFSRRTALYALMSKVKSYGELFILDSSANVRAKALIFERKIGFNGRMEDGITVLTLPLTSKLEIESAVIFSDAVGELDEPRNRYVEHFGITTSQKHVRSAPLLL